MNTSQDVQEFIAEKTLAMVGLSRDPKAFSAAAFRELTQRGYRLLPVNPRAESIAGVRCYPDLASVPEKVGGVLVFTPRAQTAAVVREAAGLGIRRLWIQQGAESPEALAYCREKDLPAVSGQCIMMFAEPVGSLHGIHRWFARLFGTLPK